MTFITTARRAALAATLALGSVSAFATPINAVDNGGFEAPTVGAGNFSYLTGVFGGWTFTGGSGVATNNSAFGVSNATGQVGLLQQSGASISQAFSFTQNLLSVTFSAEGRAGNTYGANSISVLIDGNYLLFNGSNALLPASNSVFTTYTSNVIALSAGIHTLSFVGNGVSGRDVTTFIDNVSLTTAVPEPMTLGLFGLGLVALGATRRKASRQA